MDLRYAIYLKKIETARRDIGMEKRFEAVGYFDAAEGRFYGAKTQEDRENYGASDLNRRIRLIESRRTDCKTEHTA